MNNKKEEKSELFDILYHAFNLLRDKSISETDFLAFFTKVINTYEDRYENEKC